MFDWLFGKPKPCPEPQAIKPNPSDPCPPKKAKVLTAEEKTELAREKHAGRYACATFCTDCKRLLVETINIQSYDICTGEPDLVQTYKECPERAVRQKEIEKECKDVDPRYQPRNPHTRLYKKFGMGGDTYGYSYNDPKCNH